MVQSVLLCKSQVAVSYLATTRKESLLLVGIREAAPSVARNAALAEMLGYIEGY